MTETPAAVTTPATTDSSKPAAAPAAVTTGKKQQKATPASTSPVGTLENPAPLPVGSNRELLVNLSREYRAAQEQ